MEKNQAYKALESIGWGKYNTKMFIICGMAWVGSDAWFTNLTYTLQGIQEEWDVSNLFLGFVASTFQIGYLFGSITWGILSDKYGRRLPYRLSALLSCFASVTLTFALHPFMVIGGYFILGFSVAGEVSLTSTVVCEFCPPTKRFVLTLLSLFFSFGAITSSLISLVVEVNNQTKIYNWRIILASLCLMNIVILVSRFYIKETPAYFYGKNRISEAEEILNEISMQNTNKNFKFTDLSSVLTQYNQMGAKESCNSILTELQENPPMKDILKKLFSKKLRKTTFILAFVYAAQTFGYVGLVSFILELLHFLPKFQAYLVVVILQIFGIPGVLLGSWLVETRFGRRWTGGLGFGMTAIFTFLFYFSQNFYFVIAIASMIYLNLYLGYAASFTIGPESFPTQVRTAGFGLINILGRIGGAAAPIISGALLSADGGIFIILSTFSASFLCAGLLILTLKETRLKTKENLVDQE